MKRTKIIILHQEHEEVLQSFPSFLSHRVTPITKGKKIFIDNLDVRRLFWYENSSHVFVHNGQF